MALEWKETILIFALQTIPPIIVLFICLVRNQTNKKFTTTFNHLCKYTTASSVVVVWWSDPLWSSIKNTSVSGSYLIT